MMNGLKNETSHYLRQHAENPVHWQPWSEAAFAQAKAENKPVLLSIGYSSCHWCHVMAHESFEDEEVAAIMNNTFINIKLDREEFPDIDHMYMDAVQAMTGSGGWPLNVFLTPEKKPFYGGTYFPPKRMFNRASWKEVLINVSQYFTQNRENVEQQAAQLMQHLHQNALTPSGRAAVDANLADKATTDKRIFDQLIKNADLTEGGFGQAPKFPSTFALTFLLDYYALYKDQTALNHVCLSLDKMAMGGIYDQIGGGFARYSTDRFWLAPHFEKMLYDNALLLEVYAKAWSYTHNDFYRDIVEQSIGWLTREMMNDEGAFYAAQDADSDGVEGKFYTWQIEELKHILRDDFPLFEKFYGVSEEGNWEHTNILQTNADRLASLSETEKQQIGETKQVLLAARQKRNLPLTDDKIILSWNALMNKALSLAALIFDRDDYLLLATRNMEFLLTQMNSAQTLYYHTGQGGHCKIAAYLDDLAFLASALLQLNAATAEVRYLIRAAEIATYIDANFKNEQSEFFHYTHRMHLQVAVNKTETYDGALPASSSILCQVLHHLGYIFHRPEWTTSAQLMLAKMESLLSQYPGSFGVWAATFLQGWNYTDVCVAGPNAQKNIRVFHNKKYRADVRYTGINTNEETIAELRGKYAEGECRIYICKNQHCLSPFTSTEAAMTVIYPEIF